MRTEARDRLRAVYGQIRAFPQRRSPCGVCGVRWWPRDGVVREQARGPSRWLALSKDIFVIS